RLAQHRQCEVDREHARLRPALAQRHRAAPRAAAEVEHPFRRALAVLRRPELERPEQLRFHRALQRGGGVVAVRSARERAPHLALVEAGTRIRAVHAGSSRKASSRAATASAWVRKGAWPACSTTSN